MRSFALAYMGACLAVGLSGGLLTWFLLANVPGSWAPGWAWALPAGLVLGSLGFVLGRADAPQQARMQMWDAAGYLLLPVAVVICALGERVGQVEWALGLVAATGVVLRALEIQVAEPSGSWKSWAGGVAGMGAVALPVVVLASHAPGWPEVAAEAAKALVLAWAAAAGAVVARKYWGQHLARAAAVAAVVCWGVVKAVTGGWAGTIAMAGVTAAWAGRELGWKGWGWAAAATAAWAATQGPGGQALAGGIMLMVCGATVRLRRWALGALGAGALAWALAHGSFPSPPQVAWPLVLAATLAGVGTGKWSWMGLGVGVAGAVAAGATWVIGAVVGPLTAWSAAAARGLGMEWLRGLWWIVAGAGWVGSGAAMVGASLPFSPWWAVGGLGAGMVWAWAAARGKERQASLRLAPAEVAVFSLLGLALLALGGVR